MLAPDTIPWEVGIPLAAVLWGYLGFVCLMAKREKRDR